MRIRQRTKIVRDAAEAPRIGSSLGAIPQKVIIALPPGSVKPRTPHRDTLPPTPVPAWPLHPSPPTSCISRRFLASQDVPDSGVISIPPDNGLPSESQATPPLFPQPGSGRRQWRDCQPHRDHDEHSHRVQRGQELAAGSPPALGKTGGAAV